MDCSTPHFPVLCYLQSLLKSMSLNRWCHPTVSSSVTQVSSCLQSFPASGSFPRSQFFTWGGQSIGVSTSASVLPMNIQDWFPLGWTDLISLQSKGLSRVLFNTSLKASILWDSDGQGSLACCSPWGRRESDKTERLNWTDRLLYGLTRTFVHNY